MKYRNFVLVTLFLAAMPSLYADENGKVGVPLELAKLMQSLAKVSFYEADRIQVDVLGKKNAIVTGMHIVANKLQDTNPDIRAITIFVASNPVSEVEKSDFREFETQYKAVKILTIDSPAKKDAIFDRESKLRGSKFFQFDYRDKNGRLWMSEWRDESGLVVRTEMFNGKGELKYLSILKNVIFKPDFNKHTLAKFRSINKLNVEKEILENPEALEQYANELLNSNEKK
jgi:hypothetical protein